MSSSPLSTSAPLSYSNKLTWAILYRQSLTHTRKHKLRFSTQNYTIVEIKRSGKTTTKPLNTVYLSKPEGTGKQCGPDTSNRASEVHWCALIATAQKGQKQSLAVWSGWIPLPKYLDTYPCDSYKNNGLICVYTRGKGTVCVKSTLTNDIVFARKRT